MINRITVDFIVAGELFGTEGEIEDLKDANGVLPRFGRCWWYWTPRMRLQTDKKYIPSFSLSWLCFMIDFMLWPYPVWRLGKRGSIKRINRNLQ